MKPQGSFGTIDHRHYSVTVPQLIDAAVSRIESRFALNNKPPSLADLVRLTGDLDEKVLGYRQPSTAIARQISLWYARLPGDAATSLTARALAERTRALLHST
jgi:hypothetical protein